MKIEQTAGRCGVEVYTDGTPFWPEITIEANNGEVVEVRVSVAELHNLRYCIDRVLAQLPA